MGGLVIKKVGIVPLYPSCDLKITLEQAYILAQQETTRHNIFDRIKCMFFLATPHRGSDYAKFLEGVLSTFSVIGLTSSKGYLEDLNLDSTSTQLMNDEFARLATNLTIYTFYELWSTILGTSTLIVKKGSAVIGKCGLFLGNMDSSHNRNLHVGNSTISLTSSTGLNDNERIQYLEANHRDICKFTSMDDSNYIRVKNALGTAIEGILENGKIGIKVNYTSTNYR